MCWVLALLALAVGSLSKMMPIKPFEKLPLKFDLESPVPRVGFVKSILLYLKKLVIKQNDDTQRDQAYEVLSEYQELPGVD